MARPRTRSPRIRLEYAGPWIGVRRHARTATDRRDYLEELRNGYLVDVDQAPVAIGRPGFALAGSALTGATQWIGQYTEAGGTEHPLVIDGGEIYEYSWGGGTFTKKVSTANLTTASITLSASARVHAVPFAGVMIFSDGINKAFSWNGTAGAGGLVKLTNAPVFYGQLWVYYGHLMGIKGDTTAHRISIVWSEVGTPNVGYEATIGPKTYLNIWDVTQTVQAKFVAGAATNTDLILVRENSATRLTGTITSDWQTTANREGVHEYVGTLSPSGMLVYQDTVYFFSNDGRLFKVAPGGRAEEIAIGDRELMSQQSATKFTLVDACVFDAGSYGEYLVWCFAGIDASAQDTCLVVNPKSDELAGIWSGWTHQRIGTWKDSAGNPVLVHGGGANATTATGGAIYVHGLPNGATWSDGFSAATTAIAHTATTHAMGYDTTTETYWDMADISIIPVETLTGLGVGIETPNGSHQNITLASITSSGAAFDSAIWDTDVFAADGAEQKVSVGLDTVGRWAKISANHQTLGEQFQLQSITARTMPGSAAPDLT